MKRKGFRFKERNGEEHRCLSVREGDEMSASYDCDVILVVECLLCEIHVSETGHVYSSFKVDENHSQEGCDEDNGMCN